MTRPAVRTAQFGQRLRARAARRGMRGGMTKLTLGKTVASRWNLGAKRGILQRRSVAQGVGGRYAMSMGAHPRFGFPLGRPAVPLPSWLGAAPAQPEAESGTVWPAFSPLSTASTATVSSTTARSAARRSLSQRNVAAVRPSWAFGMPKPSEMPLRTHAIDTASMQGRTLGGRGTISRIGAAVPLRRAAQSRSKSSASGVIARASAPLQRRTKRIPFDSLAAPLAKAPLARRTTREQGETRIPKDDSFKNDGFTVQSTATESDVGHDVARRIGDVRSLQPSWMSNAARGRLPHFLERKNIPPVRVRDAGVRLAGARSAATAALVLPAAKRAFSHALKSAPGLLQRKPFAPGTGTRAANGRANGERTALLPHAPAPQLSNVRAMTASAPHPRDESSRPIAQRARAAAAALPAARSASPRRYLAPRAQAAASSLLSAPARSMAQWGNFADSQPAAPPRRDVVAQAQSALVVRRGASAKFAPAVAPRLSFLALPFRGQSQLQSEATTRVVSPLPLTRASNRGLTSTTGSSAPPLQRATTRPAQAIPRAPQSAQSTARAVLSDKSAPSSAIASSVSQVPSEISRRDSIAPLATTLATTRDIQTAQRVARRDLPHRSTPTTSNAVKASATAKSHSVSRFPFAMASKRPAGGAIQMRSVASPRAVSARSFAASPLTFATTVLPRLQPTRTAPTDSKTDRILAPSHSKRVPQPIFAQDSTPTLARRNAPIQDKPQTPSAHTRITSPMVAAPSRQMMGSRAVTSTKLKPTAASRHLMPRVTAPAPWALPLVTAALAATAFSPTAPSQAKSVVAALPLMQRSATEQPPRRKTPSRHVHSPQAPAVQRRVERLPLSAIRLRGPQVLAGLGESSTHGISERASRGLQVLAGTNGRSFSARFGAIPAPQTPGFEASARRSEARSAPQFVPQKATLVSARSLPAPQARLRNWEQISAARWSAPWSRVDSGPRVKRSLAAGAASLGMARLPARGVPKSLASNRATAPAIQAKLVRNAANLASSARFARPVVSPLSADSAVAAPATKNSAGRAASTTQSASLPRVSSLLRRNAQATALASLENSPTHAARIAQARSIDLAFAPRSRARAIPRAASLRGAAPRVTSPGGSLSRMHVMPPPSSISAARVAHRTRATSRLFSLATRPVTPIQARATHLSLKHFVPAPRVEQRSAIRGDDSRGDAGSDSLDTPHLMAAHKPQALKQGKPLIATPNLKLSALPAWQTAPSRAASLKRATLPNVRRSVSSVAQTKLHPANFTAPRSHAPRDVPFAPTASPAPLARQISRSRAVSPLPTAVTNAKNLHSTRAQNHVLASSSPSNTTPISAARPTPVMRTAPRAADSRAARVASLSRWATMPQRNQAIAVSVTSPLQAKLANAPRLLPRDSRHKTPMPRALTPITNVAARANVAARLLPTAQSATVNAQTAPLAAPTSPSGARTDFQLPKNAAPLASRAPQTQSRADNAHEISLPTPNLAPLQAKIAAREVAPTAKMARPPAAAQQRDIVPLQHAHERTATASTSSLQALAPLQRKSEKSAPVAPPIQAAREEDDSGGEEALQVQRLASQVWTILKGRLRVEQIRSGRT